MLPQTLLFAAALLLAAGANGQEAWNYKQQGDDWGSTCKTGRMQSPIDIDTSKLMEIPQGTDRPIHFHNYRRLTPVKVEVEADHYTVKATPIADYDLSISGGGLPAKYKLMQMHFHWPGEHTVDSKRYILEAHLVHVKENYNSTDEAAMDPEGIAVLGVLFTEGKDNLELFKIEIGAREGRTWLNFDKILPVDKSEFYRYKGSLTTPTCGEVVIWTVFKNPAFASPLQVAAFRGLLPTKDQTVDSYRNTQPLNGRIVELWSTGRGLSHGDNIAPNPSLLFAVIPGISKSIHFPKYNHFI